MARDDYSICTEDGKRFCDRHLDENGDVILEGPHGLVVTFKSLMKQAINPAEAFKQRGKRKK